MCFDFCFEIGQACFYSCFWLDFVFCLPLYLNFGFVSDFETFPFFPFFFDFFLAHVFSYAPRFGLMWMGNEVVALFMKRLGGEWLFCWKGLGELQGRLSMCKWGREMLWWWDRNSWACPSLLYFFFFIFCFQGNESEVINSMKHKIRLRNVEKWTFID